MNLYECFYRGQTGICEVIGRRIKNRDNRKLCYHSLESRCTESGGQYQRDADDGQNFSECIPLSD